MVSAATVMILIVIIVVLVFNSNDLWLLRGHVISAADHTKKAASHTLLAKESFQNMYNDSPKMRKYIKSAERNSRKAVKQARKVIKHSKKAISRAQAIWEKCQI